MDKFRKYFEGRTNRTCLWETGRREGLGGVNGDAALARAAGRAVPCLTRWERLVSPQTQQRKEEEIRSFVLDKVSLSYLSGI